MIEQFRRFVSTAAGKTVICVFVLGLLALAVYSVKAFLNGDTPESAIYSTYIDAETGQSFRHKNEIGDTIPLKSPFSGKNVGKPAEACYWNKDGTIRSEPYWLLLNSQLGKPEPTFCPDCGRLVVARNPKPEPGSKPPPTKDEWVASHSSPEP
jgi:hypothetical protein